MDFKTLALISAIVLAATTIDSVSQDQTAFQDYKVKFGASYGNEVEESYRQAVFNKNIEMINAHNADETQTYKMDINQFADKTVEEFQSMLLRPRQTSRFTVISDSTPVEVQNVNWVERGAVQRVKDQGNCGSCWAFGAVGQVEGAKWLSTGTLGDFSEQQLTSCDTERNQGCNGGFEYLGMEYFAKNGICTDASYPYTSGNGQVPACRESSCTKDSFKVTGYKMISGVNALNEALAVRPMAVALDASNWSFYSGGIFSNCGSQLNHAVILAGSTSSYWLVKNSWGSSWGESGYIRLGPGNTCGLANEPSYSTY